MSTALEHFPAQPLPDWRRAVLKVGSSLLADADNGLTDHFATALARFIADARSAGREVVLVSSGAVAAGRGRLKATGRGLPQRQALAALGQAQLVNFWQQQTGLLAAQVLLCHDDMRNRRRYLNARATLRELLDAGALPVVNENDTVAVDELRLGDNDNLAAAVASLVDADLLLIASDVEGLYSANPRLDASAQPIARVSRIDDALRKVAAGTGSAVGTGGMITKLEAASKAATAGIATALFSGRDAAVLGALSEGRLHGTLIERLSDRLTARKQWLRHAPSGGLIRIDAGAADALGRRGASLLPGGIVSVEGEFQRGDAVEVRESSLNDAVVARGLVQYAATDLRRIVGRRSDEIAGVLGFSYGEAVIHRDDLVLLRERSIE
ncbi:MAG: glutamate 5-kinase [Lysobacteraceae bacterium]